MSVWSVEAVTKFIRVYRSHPTLWKVKSKEYTDRSMRNQAYQELIDLCKRLGFSNANRDFVSKKIQNLRGAFRKEVKKSATRNSKSGSSQKDVYKPTLWYYELLMFTKDQEMSTNSSISNIDDSETPTETVTSPSFRLCQEDEEDPLASPSPPTTATQMREKRHLKRQTNLIDTQIELMNVCSDALKQKDVNEYEALGVVFAKKLQRMNSIQALYAENLIHSILRQGVLGQLTENMDICAKGSNKTITLNEIDTNCVAPVSLSTIDDKMSIASTELL